LQAASWDFTSATTKTAERKLENDPWFKSYKRGNDTAVAKAHREAEFETWKTAFGIAFGSDAEHTVAFKNWEKNMEKVYVSHPSPP
jgi:hypothetical protein